VTSPRVRVAYEFADSGFTLAGSWGKAFKLPSLYALGHPLVGNPDLVPERGESHELELSQVLLNGAAHWSVAGRGVPGERASLASNYLPGRNLLLASLAAVHCVRARIPTIALALLADNPFPDATPAFLAGLARLASRALAARIVIRAPFRGVHKEAIIRRGRDLPLALTLSCARPRGLRHCGTCTKCAERQRAFAAAGVLDPTSYLA